jgi:hypothetical protein
LEVADLVLQFGVSADAIIIGSYLRVQAPGEVEGLIIPPTLTKERALTPVNDEKEFRNFIQANKIPSTKYLSRICLIPMELPDGPFSF